MNTKNILFICGGAFDGIEQKIAQRLNTHVVGYNSVQNVRNIDKSDLMKYILPQDLKSFGLIPEIIGRLPVLTYLNPLDRGAYAKPWQRLGIAQTFVLAGVKRHARGYRSVNF